MVSAAMEAAFEFAEIQVVSCADLYAGKIVAALDRQSCDVFDAGRLLANEGIADALRRAFLVYAISHSRPIAELLAPREKAIAREFLQNFEGMTVEPVSMEDLVAVRTALIDAIVGKMPGEHRRFLLGFKRGDAGMGAACGTRRQRSSGGFAGSSTISIACPKVSGNASQTN